MYRTRNWMLTRAGHLVFAEGDGTETEGGGDTAKAGDKGADDSADGASPSQEQKPSFTPPATQEELDRIIQKRIDRERAKFADYDDIKAQLETANSAVGRVSELDASLAAAQKRADRAELAAEVASVKGVKLRYLTGETREELEASADEVLADFKTMAKVGVVPTQGTGDPAPRVTSYTSGAERARAQADKTKEKA